MSFRFLSGLRVSIYRFIITNIFVTVITSLAISLISIIGIHFFFQPIKPQKEPSAVMIPQVGQVSMMDVDNEDSMDAPSVGSQDTPVTPGPAKKVRIDE